MVGLGNPGAEYEATRHNAGFWLAEALAARWGLPRFKRDGQARVTGGETPSGRVHLIKPWTYMNLSGRVLSGLRAPDPDTPLPDLLVLVDDFAIPAGTFRMRSGGSAGGHNGLKSIEQVVGTRLYPRLRIGVGPVPEGMPHHDFVLEGMPREERRLVDDLLPEMMDAVACWMTDGIDTAMNRFNRKTKAGDE